VIRVLGVNLTWTVAAELLAALLAVVAGSMAVSGLIQRALVAWARRRGIPPEDAAIPLVRRYLVPVLLVGALHLALSALDLPRNLRLVVTRLLSATTLALVLYLTSQVILALLDRSMRQTEPGRRAGRQLMTMARITLLVVSLAFLLDNLGIRVTALVTTLGVTSLAVALALQDTLSNFFAGIYLQADRPFRLGHYVRLDTGDEGTVVDIGWRSTRLRTMANNTVVVPNERLLKSIITNYDLPDSQTSLALRVTVPYGTQIETVERLLLEAVRRARADVPGILEAPPPVVRLIPGFGDQGLLFTLTLWLRAFLDQEPAQHAVRRAIVELFRAESIELRRG
jgi:small-conductance mechanosensitive channel